AALRRYGEVRVATAGIALYGASTVLSATPWLPLVLAGTALFGAGLAWLLIALVTLVQRSTPHGLQARVYAATNLAVATPQTVSIALGAALLAVLDYRVLLLACATVAAVSAGWLGTRDASTVPSGHPTPGTPVAGPPAA
ncbi:MAG TPA: MFS transporter, partial [Rugosimonospora sp.]|nr:MFS transporter [Rugosimonospora sp.]